MRYQKVRIATALILAVSAVNASTPLTAQPQSSQVRVIPFDPAAPITSRLVVGDRIVVVEKLQETPLYVTGSAPSHDQGIRELSNCSALVLAAGLKSQGLLIDGGTWIRTRLTAHVIDVVRTKGRAPLQVGDELEFAFDGGQVTISGVEVRAGFAPVFDGTARHLLCLSFNSLASAWSPTQILPIDRTGRLAPYRSASGDQGPYSVLHGALLDSVLNEVRRH